MWPALYRELVPRKEHIGLIINVQIPIQERGPEYRIGLLVKLFIRSEPPIT
jgi:hypothetical protein